MNLVDPSGQFGIGGALLGGITGAAIGGIMAAVTGGDIYAGMAGGAVSGAIFGSGAGIVTWAFSQFGLTTGALSGVAVGALSGGLGNITQQIFSNGSCGDLNWGEVGQSTAFGGLLGGIGGLSTMGTIAMQNSNMALNASMSNYMNTISSELFQMGASQSIVNGARNAIVRGMQTLGNTNANATAIITASETFGLTTMDLVF